MSESERQYRNREWLEEQIYRGLTAREISDQVDVTHQTINKWIRKNDLEELYRVNCPSKYTDAELIEWHILFYEEFGRFPKMREIQDGDSPLPSYDAYHEHFGGLENARERAREVMNDE